MSLSHWEWESRGEDGWSGAGRWVCRRRRHAEPCVRVVFDQENLFARRLRVLSYRATLDVPIATVRTVSG